MMSEQHTPGPWAMSRDAVPPGHVQVTIYAEASGARVATAFETEWNARLIAAAPDLLATLRELVSKADGRQQRKTYPDTLTVVYCATELDEARALLTRIDDAT